jgi:hypothetical protein
MRWVEDQAVVRPASAIVRRADFTTGASTILPSTRQAPPFAGSNASRALHQGLPGDIR